MATITTLRRKNGAPSYRAQIRVRRGGEVVYSETETFTKKSLAKAWADKRESELRMPGALDRVRHSGITASQVLEWYRDDFDGRSKFGRSKLSTIEFLINNDELSKLDAIELTSAQLVDYVRSRRAEGAGAATVSNDLIWLRNAFRAVKIGRNIPLSLEPIDDAAFLCRKEKLIARPTRRERRPTIEELDEILDYYAGKRTGIPMYDVVLFALFSSRRQDEICRIRWKDVDSKKQRVLVRDMKHPRELIDTWVHLPDRAWEVLQRQSKDSELIFPYNSKSVSSSFTRACKFLDISDLRFHDLRHEAASWLFETGLDIPRVAQITGHRSWSSLQRYTHLQEHEIFDKYEGWRV